MAIGIARRTPMESQRMHIAQSATRYAIAILALVSIFMMCNTFAGTIPPDHPDDARDPQDLIATRAVEARIPHAESRSEVQPNHSIYRTDTITVSGTLTHQESGLPVQGCKFRREPPSTFNDPQEPITNLTTIIKEHDGATNEAGEWSIVARRGTPLQAQFSVADHIHVTFEIPEHYWDNRIELTIPRLADLRIRVRKPELLKGEWVVTVEPHNQDYEDSHDTVPRRIISWSRYGAVKSHILNHKSQPLGDDIEYTYHGWPGVTVVASPSSHEYSFLVKHLLATPPAVIEFAAEPMTETLQVHHVDSEGKLIHSQGTVFEIPNEGDILLPHRGYNLLDGKAFVPWAGRRYLRLQFTAPGGEWFFAEVRRDDYPNETPITFAVGGGKHPISLPKPPESSVVGVWYETISGKIIRADSDFADSPLRYWTTETSIDIPAPHSGWLRVWAIFSDGSAISSDSSLGIAMSPSAEPASVFDLSWAKSLMAGESLRVEVYIAIPGTKPGKKHWVRLTAKRFTAEENHKEEWELSLPSDIEAEVRITKILATQEGQRVVEELQRYPFGGR